MKIISFTLILIIASTCFGQKSLDLTEECTLFKDSLIIKLSEKHFNNPNYNLIKNNWIKRKELLVSLEEHLLVFRSSLIGPALLESESNPQSCPEFTKRFQELKIEQPNLSTQEIRAIVQKPYLTDVLLLLLDLSGLLREEDSQDVAKYLSEIHNSYTLEYIFNEYQANFIEPCRRGNFPLSGDTTFECLSQYTYENNLRLISERIDRLDKIDYSHYEGSHSKANMLKGFEAHHDNDVFILIPGKNQDREYTGGFKFSFITDYFKCRYFRFGAKPENVLAYQSISVGGFGYTPYIRYRNNFSLADSMHKNDRPFGSYLFIERAKYRTWQKGLIRLRGELQVGSIGLSQGRKIQAKLHEDVIHRSQFVYGWDNQIGNGGRLALQMNQKVDVLLFSTSNRYVSVFMPGKTLVLDKKKYSGFNVVGEVDLRIGGFYTSAGVGIRISTLDFLKQSGTQQIMIRKPEHKREFGWKFDIGLNYRYVQHNTMLEGLGYWKTFPEDSYDKVNPDFFVLPKERVERNLVILDFGLNLRFRKSTLYFRQTFHTLEYKTVLGTFNYQQSGVISSINPNDIDYYNATVVKENKSFANSTWFGGKTFYGYGTLGMSWIIE